jgi:tellurite resistance protein TerB
MLFIILIFFLPIALPFILLAAYLQERRVRGLVLFHVEQAEVSLATTQRAVLPRESYGRVGGDAAMAQEELARAESQAGMIRQRLKVVRNHAAAARRASAGKQSSAMQRLLSRADHAVNAVEELILAADDTVRHVRAAVGAARRAAILGEREARRQWRRDRAQAARAEWAAVGQRLLAHGSAAVSAVRGTPQGIFTALRTTLDGTRSRDRSLSDAAMAACALVATADGQISSDERERVQMLIEENGILTTLESRRLAKSFESFCQSMLARNDIARPSVEAAIRGVRGMGYEGTLVELATVVARSCGISEAEQAVIHRIRSLASDAASTPNESERGDG